MSHHASSWALEQTPTMPETGKLDPHGKLVLIVLADKAGQEGVVWAGSRSIAEQACMPPESVRRVTARLEAVGLIAKIERFRDDGSRTTSVIVLAPHGGRGAMHPAQSHPRFGREIGEWLAAHAASTERSGVVTDGHGSVTPRHGAVSLGCGGSEPVSEPVSDPEDVEVERASAYEAPLPTLPSTGDDLGEVRDYLQGVANHVGGRFAAAWFGDQDRVMRVIAAEQPAVRLVVCDYLCRQALAGWRTPGMAMQVGGRIVERARAVVDEQARTPGTAPAAASTAAQRTNARRRELIAIIEGDRQ